MSKILKCDNITKNFGGLTALDGVSLEIEEGKTYGLIGPNGAGKTTLFNIISGSLECSSGTITYKGRDITNLKNYEVTRSGIARTFQIPRPFSSLTVEENVLIGLEFGDTDSSTRSCDEILEFVNLAGEASTSPASLNLFQKKKLDMARALATGADFILFDEIMAGLNPAQAQKFTGLIEEIAKTRTVLFIEHIMDIVMEISDQIVVLNHGRKLAEGSPREVTSNEQVLEAYLGSEGDNYA